MGTICHRPQYALFVQRIVKSIRKIALALLILVLSTSLNISRVGEVSPISKIQAKSEVSITIVKPVLTVLPDIFKKIAWCESKNMQFNADGSVHRGVANSQDVGKYQINEYYHLRASQALGIDIYTLEGNTKYALHLYKHEGTTPWHWSEWCWNDKNVLDSTWEVRYKQNI